jgi:hypothetical protein
MKTMRKFNDEIYQLVKDQTLGKKYLNNIKYCNAGLQELEFTPLFFALVIWWVLFIQLCQLKAYKTVYFAWWCCSNCRNLLMNTWVLMKMSCTTFDISGELFMIHCLFLLKYKWIPAYIKILGTVGLSLNMYECLHR